MPEFMQDLINKVIKNKQISFILKFIFVILYIISIIVIINITDNVFAEITSSVLLVYAGVCFSLLLDGYKDFKQKCELIKKINWENILNDPKKEEELKKLLNDIKNN